MKHKVVVGLGFGDEGKGTIVDYITSEREHEWVVRFSGGPQAAHNVVTYDGRHHTFAQFGAGYFNGASTILSRFMLVNPFNLIEESESLKEFGRDPLDTVFISENCLVITPWHVTCNQLTEDERGDDRHGSCGQGVGVAQKFALDYPDLALRMKDLSKDYNSLVAQLMMIESLLVAEYGSFTRRTPGNLTSMYLFLMRDHQPIVVPDEEISAVIRHNPCVFEGSQGALLDEWKGFHPYTTWSTTTAENALTLLSEAGVDTDSDVEVIGVTRTYHTRHGAGPFPTEDGQMSEIFPEEHNGTGLYQGDWRVGALDLELLEYAAKVSPRIDSVALTHTDRELIISDRSQNLHEMSGTLEDQEYLTRFLFSRIKGSRKVGLHSMISYIEEVVEAPVRIMSYGPQTDQKKRVDMAP